MIGITYKYLHLKQTMKLPLIIRNVIDILYGRGIVINYDFIAINCDGWQFGGDETEIKFPRTLIHIEGVD